MTGKYALPRVRPVLLVHDPGPQVADRPQAERLEMSQGLGVDRRGLGLDASRVGTYPRTVGRSSRVDPRPEAVS